MKSSPSRLSFEDGSPVLSCAACPSSRTALARSHLGFIRRKCCTPDVRISVPLHCSRNPGKSRLLPRLTPLSVQKKDHKLSWTLLNHWRCLVTTSDKSTMTTNDSLEHLHKPDSISYLTQAEAAAIDEELMGDIGFSIDQLMELAGLSVACAIAEVFGVQQYKRVLVICGPGNNGGDGLVASKHLFHFGYKPAICYPKQTDKPIYRGLVTQLRSLSVPFLPVEELESGLSQNFDIVIDAIFGFSFRGMPRSPFDRVIKQLAPGHESIGSNSKVPPIISVDIPSGWDVEEGDKDGTGLKAEMLVSLTAPKLCAKQFKGPHHYLGGRFVPPALAEKYKLKLPPYPGTSQCVRIGKPPTVDVAALRENYTGAVLLEDQVQRDPIKQFQEWFEDAVAAGLTEPNAMSLATADCNGHPSSRMVLLKGYDHRGFVWYTNYKSRKAAELFSNPRAALVFFWDRLHRQVRIEGRVEKVSDEETEEYFHSRPWGSQIGAIVSPQSEVLPNREALDERYREICEKYADGSYIPRPEWWGGFRLRPEVIEFWQGRESRLHDRLRFTLEGNDQQTWSMQRLAP